jgi:hypothetical protein
VYISLRDSCSKGFNKWSEAHQPKLNKDILTNRGDDIVVANRGLSNSPMMSPERHHDSALAPGPGEDSE